MKRVDLTWIWHKVRAKALAILRADSTPRRNESSGIDSMLGVQISPKRSRQLFCLMTVVFGIVMCRAAYLQCGIQTEFLQKKGEERYARTIPVPAQRGRILDRNGIVLASSIPAKSIWAIPSETLGADKGQLKELASLLEVPTSTLLGKLTSKKESTFVYLARKVDLETAQKIADLRIPGIYDEDESKRNYPDGEVSAHVVGYTDTDNHGREGVELACDETLSGQKGMRYVIRDRLGQRIDSAWLKEATRGRDVVLSIDSRLQYIAYKAVRRAVEDARAKAAAVVVADVHTGEILAMNNLPTYDPNQRKDLRIENVRNRVLTDMFEPGSTMKPFAIAKALDLGIVRPDTLVETGPGVLNIGDRSISDTHNYGMLTVSQIVSKSSNIGTCKIALEINSEDLWATYDALGFGKVPNVHFPGAIRGKLRRGNLWRPVEKATISYGYGISVSLMQLVRAYTALARNGDVIDLTFKKSPREAVGQQVFRPEVARQMRTMMSNTVLQGGTAQRVNVQGYTVAGKTGTANKLRDGKYVDKLAVGSFIGMAPASHPRLIVAVMIDEPTRGSYFGGTVAAPVFNEVMAGALRLIGVNPDAPDYVAGPGISIRGIRHEGSL